MKNRITGIYIYPIKSLAGVPLESSSLCSTGLQNDRRWMLVDQNGLFITQRDMKALCLFKVHMHASSLTITFREEHVTVPLTLETGNRLRVKVWDSVVDAIAAPHSINDWFTGQLGKQVTLVYMPDSTHRSINSNHVIANERVGFADGYPLLLIGEASLALLQSKIQESIPMDRFRPNIVFSSSIPHEEDTWQYFTINRQTFRGIKPCKRCKVTTINQQTAESNAEPLKTLATYRNIDNHILFGQNVAVPASGIISIGDSIDVIDYLPQ